MNKIDRIEAILRERNIQEFGNSIKQPAVYDGLLITLLYIVIIYTLCL